MSHRASAFPAHARAASTSTRPTGAASSASSSNHNSHNNNNATVTTSSSSYSSSSSVAAGGMHQQQHQNQQGQKNAQRTRQYAHLHAALAQLNAHLADTENLLRMTAVQAEYVRGLGGWTGGLFMAAARVLGEETTTTTTATAGDAEAGASAGTGKEG